MDGSLTHELLREILDQLRTLAGLPNESDTACRCGDSAYNYLRKIVHVARLDAGLPDIPGFEFRPGDADYNLSFKLMTVLTDETCRCGDSIYRIWQRILHDLRVGAGLPDTPEFEFRPGDSLNDILRKILAVLGGGVIPPPECCLPVGDYGLLTDPVTLSCDWGGVLEAVECADDWGDLT